MNNSNNRRVCFACTTPYQIMNAISIVYNDLLNADIFIFNTFDKYKEVSSRLSNEKIFRNVYCLNFYSKIKICNIKIVSRLYCALRFVFASQYIKKIIPNGSVYDSVYVSSQAIPKMVLIRALEKWNPKIKIVIYEDGMGTYVQNGHALNGSQKFQFLKKILKFKFRPEGRTIFMPRLPQIAPPLEAVNDYKVIAMKPLPIDECRTILKNVFIGDSLQIKINEKIIVFDDLRIANDKKIYMLDSLYDFIHEQYPTNSICKSHPRSQFNTKSNIKFFPFTHIPVEIIYMGTDNLEDKIIVSVFSTASFTPALLFGKYPALILLYKMLLDDDDILQMDMLVNKMKKIYKNKIYTPLTPNEFKECFTFIK